MSELENLLEREDIPEDALAVIRSSIADQKKIEETIKESEEKYRLISENTDDLIVITNPINRKFIYS